MISNVLVFKGNRPTDWGPDPGGVQVGGLVTGRECMSNTFFALAVCGGKLSQIFSNFLEWGGGLSDTFLVLEFWGEKKLSEIFSNFLGIHFYVLAFWENYLKFSQNFQNFLKFFQLILNKIFVPNDVGWGADWVGGSRLGGWYAGYIFTI